MWAPSARSTDDLDTCDADTDDSDADADAGTAANADAGAQNYTSSTHENTPYLPGIKLSELIVATTEVSEATEGADIVFVVVPTPFIRGARGSLARVHVRVELCGGSTGGHGVAHQCKGGGGVLRTTQSRWFLHREVRRNRGGGLRGNAGSTAACREIVAYSCSACLSCFSTGSLAWRGLHRCVSAVQLSVLSFICPMVGVRIVASASEATDHCGTPSSSTIRAKLTFRAHVGRRYRYFCS